MKNLFTKTYSLSFILLFFFGAFDLNAQTATSNSTSNSAQNVKSESASNESSAAKTVTNLKYTTIHGKKIADNGYFTYEVTVDVGKNAELYQIAKEKFMTSDPESYNKWSHGEVSNSTPNKNKKQ